MDGYSTARSCCSVFPSLRRWGRLPCCASAVRWSADLYPGCSVGWARLMADVIYGGIAAAGLTLVADFLVGQQFWLRLLGGGFLICLGISTLLQLALTEVRSRCVRTAACWRDFFSTLALTAQQSHDHLCLYRHFWRLWCADCVRPYRVHRLFYWCWGCSWVRRFGGWG